MSPFEHGEVVEAAVARSRRVGRSPWLGWAGRVGLVAKGVSYALVGVLAIALASGRARRRSTATALSPRSSRRSGTPAP